jgi:acetyl-CoA synthetase
VKGHDEYLKLYRDSLDNNDAFWSRMAKEHISWSAPFQQTKQQGPRGTADTHWFVGGQLNACYNAVDRHVPEHGDKVAIIWESDDGKSERKITYAQLHAEVQRAANALKALGVGKGDVVVLYMPMVPEVRGRLT